MSVRYCYQFKSSCIYFYLFFPFLKIMSRPDGAIAVDILEHLISFQKLIYLSD